MRRAPSGTPPPVRPTADRGASRRRRRSRKPDRQTRLSVLLLLVALPLTAGGYFVVLNVTKPQDVEPTRVEVGPQSVVFDWGEDACEAFDIPDLPVRAFRDAGGQVQMFNSHFVTRRFVGSGLDSLRHRCGPVMRSDRNPDPAAFDDAEWLASPYTLDGKTVFALVHNEYHGHEHSGRCPSGEYYKCWYNSITLAVSRDGGKTFSDARPPPGHLVASLPYRYVPDIGPLGILEPSNIVRHRDDHYYFLARTEKYRAQEQGACVFRARDISDPRSWRAWDGDSFDRRLVNPYSVADTDGANRVCKPVSPGEISTMSQSLTYNTFLKRYVLVGSSADTPAGGKTIHGIYFSTSDNLIDWSYRRLILPAEFAHTFRCGDPNPIAYPSLLDPQSKSRNFETTGRRAYLYFTRLNYHDCKLTADRDLIRTPIEFSR